MNFVFKLIYYVVNFLFQIIKNIKYIYNHKSKKKKQQQLK